MNLYFHFNDRFISDLFLLHLNIHIIKFERFFQVTHQLVLTLDNSQEIVPHLVEFYILTLARVST